MLSCIGSLRSAGESMWWDNRQAVASVSLNFMDRLIVAA
jgi:hypothetical protein